MPWLTYVLFESPLALGAVLFVANYVLLVYWRRRGRVRPLLVGLAAAAVLLFLQKLIVTQREQAVAILTPIERDVMAGRTEALAAALAADFAAPATRGSELDRDAFLEFARRALERVRVQNVSRQHLDIEQSERDRFVVRAAYTATVALDSYSTPVQSRWRITFTRNPGGWRIGRIDLPELQGMTVRDWGDLGARR